MRILAGVLAAALCTPAHAQDLLLRIREKMAGVLLRQPNYTCTETVERSRQAVGSRGRIEDTLRLEVALVEGKEMFAWPGSKRFEDRELSDLVVTGMFGDGNFATYAKVLFLMNVATFEDRGETQLSGRPAVRYDFRVPRSTNVQRLRVNNREGMAGFHGSFYADPVTLDIRRVEVIGEDIPADLGIDATEISLNYGRLQIGEEEFLLPVESELMMASPDAVSRNWIRFSSCRRFAGESTLSFNDPILEETSTPGAPMDVTIPAGLLLYLEMPALDLMQAAVGDPVRATLRNGLKIRRQLLAPAGSVAGGRILRLDRYPDRFILQIGFQDLDWPGGHAHLNLSFEQTVLPTRLIAKAQPGGEILISRQNGPRLSAILMVWRSEP